MQCSFRAGLTSALTVAAAMCAAPARAQVFDDQLVQPPTLEAPAKASLAGSLSGLTFGAGDLVRGSFALPLPLTAPEQRGLLLARIWPTYSPDGALTEFGHGWEVETRVRRFRPLGDVQFDSGDQLTSPWGTLARGDDGAYYPTGQGKGIRATLEPSGDLRVVTADGTEHRFLQTDAVVGAGGIFEWRLSQVRDVSGRLTQLIYERNATNRPFLRRVRYGGHGGAPFQHEIELTYQLLSSVGGSIVGDYRSGLRQDLDRRVDKIFVKTLHAGAFQTRVTYTFGYQTSLSGSAFYLNRVDTAYRSGESAPPVQYVYDVDRDLEAQPARTVDGLRDFLEEHGTLALQPRASTLVDVDDDGLLDVEHGNALLLHQTEPGVFVEVPLVPAANPDARCLPVPIPGVAPRTLARMSPAAEAPSVVVLSQVGASATEVVECKRDGAVERIRQLSGVWQLGATTRLTDADRDGRPDLVRISNSKIEVVSNRPTGWVVQPVQNHPSFSVTSAWIHDMNGDGISDVVATNPSGLGLWYGKGRLTFESSEVRPKFQLLSGGTFTGWSGSLSFVDANGDGATDVVVTNGSVARLFVNRGQVGAVPHLFEQVALPSMPGLTKYPLPAELSGSGERELTWVDGAVATALPLTEASTGLLISADDGKGSSATFSYARADAARGLRSRTVVLHRITVATTGEEPMTLTYSYGRPTMHSQARYLVGFTDVSAAGPARTELVTFHNDDDYGGLLTASKTIEIEDPVERFTVTSYEEVPYHGLRLMRATQRQEGISGRDGAGAVAATTRILTYERDLCVTRTEQTTRHGVLTRTTVLAEVAGLPADLHCLSRQEELVGSHADPSRNFHYVAELARDPIGKVTQVTALAPPGGTTGPVILQQLRYDALHRLERVIVPGEGQITASYDDVTGILSRVVAPDGVAHETVRREPVTDLATIQSVTRGGAIDFKFYFGYDGLERLGAKWDDAAGSEASPIESYRYRYATAAGALGQIALDVRIDAASTRAEIALATGANGEAATLRRIPEGWAIADLHERRRTTLEASSYFRAPLPTELGPGGAVTYADLLAGATELYKSAAIPAEPGGEGGGIVERRTLTTGVVGEERTRRFVDDGDLVAEVDDGVGVRHEGRDEASRVLWRVDEEGETTSFEYDALGRIVAIDLPGGRQTQQFDPLGRVARIDRLGVSSLQLGYDGFGRLQRTELRAPDDRLERMTTVEYDTIGRVSRENQTLAATGETRVLRYFYDGVVPGEPLVPGQLGRLTLVSGPGFTRQTLYGADGRVHTSTIVVDGLGGVEQEYGYYADGTIETETWTTLDAQGDVRWLSQRRDEYDGYGRLARVFLDGGELARFAYDGLGRISTASLVDGGRVTYEYEPLTGALVGYARTDASGRQDGARWGWNQRGLVATQTLVVDDVRKLRSYDYDPRRQLVASFGPAAAAYTYGAAGLPASASDMAGPRTFVRDGNTIDAGGVSYLLDDIGRVVARGDLAFAYGPDGQLATASRAADTWDFLYDEAGNRIGKAKNGAMISGFIGGGLFTGGAYAVPFRVNGKIVGLLTDGLYSSLLVDGAGTVVREGQSAANIATPFGVRASHPAMAEAIDYVEKGYDADLATIRFGARDYDPYLGQFTTPDPAMLSSMERCGESTLDCSLYAFARNDPLSFVDPSGLTPKPGQIASALLEGFTGAAHRVWVHMTEPLAAAYRGDPGARADLAKQYALEVAAHTPPGMAGRAVGELVGEGIEGVATARQLVAEVKDRDFNAMAAHVGEKAFENALEAGTHILMELGVRAAAKAPGTIRINPYRTAPKVGPAPPRSLASTVRDHISESKKFRGQVDATGKITPEAKDGSANFEITQTAPGRYELSRPDDLGPFDFAAQELATRDLLIELNGSAPVDPEVGQ